MSVIKLFLALSLLIAPVGFSATLINGAGATFPYPLYSKWISAFHAAYPDYQINYQSIGSGGGIRQFIDRTVDFGASDAPMTDEQIKAASEKGGAVLHIPTALGAVVISYNLPEIGSAKLNLTGEVISAIFLGQIKTWNDERIVKLNPEQKGKLKGDILPVHRSDGSGTTHIFTSYLAEVSPQWKTAMGAGTTVEWKSGLGGKGNEGVAGMVKQTPGSIGYVELIYAEANQLAFAAVQNSENKFISPTLESVTAAAASLKTIPDDFRMSLKNASGKASYPISSFTYLLVWAKMPDAVKGKGIVTFLRWAIEKGQSYNQALKYSELPKELSKRILKKIDTISINEKAAARVSKRNEKARPS